MKIIDTADEFAELPIGAVVRDAFGNVYQRAETFGATHRGWWTVGSEIDVHHKEFELPVTVLYDPNGSSPDEFVQLVTAAATPSVAAWALRTASLASRGQHFNTAPEVTAWLDELAGRFERGEMDS